MDTAIKKIALIVPRYGELAAGRVPDTAYRLAHKLKAFYSVTVLTSTAKDYDSWESYYEEGECEDDGITVIRFNTTQTRNIEKFERHDAFRTKIGPLGGLFDKKLILEQGPVVRGLAAFVRDHLEEFDRFVYLTYRYFPTAAVYSYTAGKSVIIPLTSGSSDENYLKRGIYKNLLKSAERIIYTDNPEKEMIESAINPPYPKASIGVTGFEIPSYAVDPEKRAELVAEFREKYGIKEDYILYTGQVSKERGCDDMFECFGRFREKVPDSKLKLCVIGKTDADIALPADIGAYYPGFVSEKERIAAIAGARFIWITADSEADLKVFITGLMLGVPGFVDQDCRRVFEEGIRSEAAFYYVYDVECIDKLKDMETISGREYARMSVSGRFYAEDHYGWDAVLTRMRNTIES